VRESLRQVLWAFGFAGLGVSGLFSPNASCSGEWVLPRRRARPRGR
jgi:hypothetical protein